MNSMSRTHYQNDNDPCPKPKIRDCKALLRCGVPGSVTVPAATVAGTTFTLASVTVNTSGFCDPCVKLEFASNLVASVAFTGTINFQIFRLCNNQLTPVPVGPVFTFSLVALLSSQTFSFFVCDCDSCFNECCTYTVVATVTSAVTVGTLSINNASLSALAVDNTCQCC